MGAYEFLTFNLNLGPLHRDCALSSEKITTGWWVPAYSINLYLNEIRPSLCLFFYKVKYLNQKRNS